MLDDLLRASDYRLVAEAIPAIVWSCPADGLVDYVNARWCEFTGMSVDESLGFGFEAAIHADDRDVFGPKWIAAQAAGVPFEAELRLRRSDGRYRWHVARALPLTVDGEIVRWFGSSVDVHESKRAERNAGFLADASARLSATLDEDAIVDALLALAVPAVGDACIVSVGDRTWETGGVETERARHVAPFLARGELLGEVTIVRDRGMDFADRRLCEDLARHAALALANARLLDEERQARLYREFVAEANAILNRSLDLEETLESIVELAVPALADWCIVNLADEDGRIRSVATAHRDREHAERLALVRGRALLDPAAPFGPPWVVRNGHAQAYSVIDVAHRDRLADDPVEFTQLLGALGYGSALNVPMRAEGRVIGAISFIYADHRRTYDLDDLTLAQELARHATIAVLNASAFSREHHVAMTLQRALLPASLPERPGIKIDATYLASERDTIVGGDWFDAFALDDGRVVLAIGDVAGHGIEAAIAMSTVRQACRVAAYEGRSAGSILATANRLVCRDPDPTLATACVGIFDPRSNTLAYAVAGHPPILIAGDGGVARSEPGGLPLGIDADAVFPDRLMHLPRKGLVTFYTDGITEIERDAALGEQRLAEGVAAQLRVFGDPNDAESILRRVLTARPHDDICLLTLRIA